MRRGEAQVRKQVSKYMNRCSPSGSKELGRGVLMAVLEIKSLRMLFGLRYVLATCKENVILKTE